MARNTRYVVHFTVAEMEYETLLAKYKAALPDEKLHIQQAYASGEALSCGRYTDFSKGAFGIFESAEAAEKFAKTDPLLAAGIVTSYTIDEFRELAIDEPATV